MSITLHSLDESSSISLYSPHLASTITLFAIDPLLDSVDELASIASSSSDDNRQQAREKLLEWRNTLNTLRQDLQPHLHQLQRELYECIQELDDEEAPDPEISFEQKPRSQNSDLLLETLRLLDDFCLAHRILLEQNPLYTAKSYDAFNLQEVVFTLFKSLYQQILGFDPSADSGK